MANLINKIKVTALKEFLNAVEKLSIENCQLKTVN